jgi:NADH dehydrogenase FAD-containing subunit
MSAPGRPQALTPKPTGQRGVQCAPGTRARRVVLVGAGHAHALLLRDWARQPVPGVELVLVSPTRWAPYSGMVPGWLAGHYRFEDTVIDAAALARAAGARWVEHEVRALDAARGTLSLDRGGPLQADWISLNIGSTLHPPAWLTGQEGLRLLPLRPLWGLRPAWEAVLQDPAPPAAVAAVGGGAAGVESLLAILWRLRQRWPGAVIPAHLFQRESRLLPSMPLRAAQAAAQALTRAGVRLHLGTPFGPGPARLLHAARPTGMAAGAPLLIWAAGAQPHAWPVSGGLAADAAGFVAVDATLRSVSHPRVLAAGDCAGFTPPLPKAGVQAVRMGPGLTHNLRAALAGRPLQAVPLAPAALALLALGDRQALATRGGWVLTGGPRLGRVLWRWKDRIDRGFVGGFVREPL